MTKQEKVRKGILRKITAVPQIYSNLLDKSESAYFASDSGTIKGRFSGKTVIVEKDLPLRGFYIFVGRDNE